MQYNVLKHLVSERPGPDGAVDVTLPRELFRHLLAGALKQKGYFDPQYYLAANDDVREAVERRQIESAEAHYFLAGYLENRLPRKILVDEAYYLATNPDVEAAVRRGLVASAQQHFETVGFSEGRSPHDGFRLF